MSSAFSTVTEQSALLQVGKELGKKCPTTRLYSVEEKEIRRDSVAISLCGVLEESSSQTASWSECSHGTHRARESENRDRKGPTGPTGLSSNFEKKLSEMP